MLILDNKSPKVITLAVGESLEFTPVFEYDIDYDDTTSATSVVYESKDPNIVSVGEFGYILANQIGETEITYLVDNPAFVDGSIYFYTLKVNVIERSKDEEKDEFRGEDIPEVCEPPKESDQISLPPVYGGTTSCPKVKREEVKVCNTENTKRAVNYLSKVFESLHNLMDAGTYTNEYGSLTNFSIGKQLDVYDAIKNLVSVKYMIDNSFVERAMNDFCGRSEEHKVKLEKVLSYNASWDSFTKGIYSKYRKSDRTLFLSWLNAIVTSTFRL